MTNKCNILVVMEKHSNYLDFILGENCDLNVAKGIEKFLLSCDNNPSISLTSKPSVINLIRIHIDKPFKECLRKRFQKNHRNIFESFNISDIGKKFPSEKKIKRYDLILIQKSIFEWEVEIRKYRKKLTKSFNSTSTEELLVTLGTLERLLNYINNSFSANVAHFKLNERELNGKSKTTLHRTAKNRNCKLCWRPTMKSSNEKTTNIEDMIINQARLSDQYCDFHNPNNIDTKKNYIRDRRYQDLYNHELKASYPNGPKSKFEPGIRWYLHNCEFRLFEEEIHKLAYLLSHSRLDTKRRKKIIKLRDSGKKTSEIAKKLNLSRQAILKNLNHIKQKQYELLNDIYLKQDEIDDPFQYMIYIGPASSRELTNNIDYSINKIDKKLK